MRNTYTCLYCFKEYRESPDWTNPAWCGRCDGTQYQKEVEGGDIAACAPVIVHKLDGCFFCGATNGDEADAYPAPLCQLVRIEGGGGAQKLAVATVGAAGGFVGRKRAFFRKRIVKVPRCRGCRDQHERRQSHEDLGARIGAYAGPFVFGLPVWVWAIYNLKWQGGIPLKLFALVCFLFFGLLLGMALGGGIGTLTRPRMSEGVGAVTRAKDFPSIAQMLRNRWKIVEAPDTFGATAFGIELEAERQYMVADRND